LDDETLLKKLLVISKKCVVEITQLCNVVFLFP